MGAANAWTGGVAITDCSAGATDCDASIRNTLGSYFQWGRNEDVTALGSTATQSSTGTSSTVVGSFVKGAVNNYDWLVDASKNDNLWGGSGTTPLAGTFATRGSPAEMKGPCQTGYHVPTAKEWCDAITAVSPDVTACDRTWHVETTANKFITTLKLPLAGDRDYSSAAYNGQ